MCRWKCVYNDTTYMCKFCGTRFCRVCLKGDFVGFMLMPDVCKKCNQKKCVGKRVEYEIGQGPSAATKERFEQLMNKENKKGNKKGKKSKKGKKTKKGKKKKGRKK